MSSSVLPIITITRWNSIYLQMINLIEKRPEISQICSEENIDNIRDREWDLLQEYVELFKPFNGITNEMNENLKQLFQRFALQYSS